MTPAPPKQQTKYLPLRLMLDSGSSLGPGTCEVSGTFLAQFTSPSCLALSRIGGLYTRVVGSSPRFSPSSALPAWHRNRTQLASFMERDKSLAVQNSSFGAQGYSEGVRPSVRSPATATLIPNHVSKYSDHCTPCLALASDTRSNKPILSQHDSRFL